MKKGKKQENYLVLFYPACERDGTKPPPQVLYCGVPKTPEEVVCHIMGLQLHKELLTPCGGGQFYFGLEKAHDPNKIGGRYTWLGTRENGSGPLRPYLLDHVSRFFKIPETATA